MKKNIFTFLLFLFTTLINAENIKQKSVIKPNSETDSVFVKFNMDKGEILNLRLSNQFLESQIIENIKNGDDFRLYIGNKLSYLHVFKTIMNDSGVLVKEGDSLEISYKQGKFIFHTLSKNNNDSNLNIWKEYYEFVKYQKPFNQISTAKKNAISKKNISEVLKLNEQLFKLRNDFIKEYERKFPIDNEYKSAFIGQYKFTTLGLDYWDIKSLGNQKELSEKYSEIIKLLQTQNINTEIVNLFFDLFVDYHKTIIPSSEKEDKAKFAQLLFNSIKRDFAGYNRDVLVIQLLYKGRNKELQEKFYNDFKIFAEDVAFLNKAQEIIGKNSEKQNFEKKNDTHLKRINGKQTTLKELLERYKGSYVYVDFWASWCAPCRLEMPKTLEASKKYNNIKFLFISTDENQEQWKKAHQKILVGYEDSFLLLNQSSSDFIKEIKLEAIPRHILFDKNGNMSYGNFPGADDSAFERLLNQYNK